MKIAAENRATRGMLPTEAAAYWHVRRDGRELTAEEQAEFDDWMAESPANARQFAHMVALEQLSGQAKDDSSLFAMRQKALAMRPARSLWRMGGVALAAASLVIGIFVLRPAERFAEPTIAIAPAASMRSGTLTHVTHKGELRTVRLPDGSKVTLNTDSELRVAFSPQRRAVHLLRGQALFEIAHDAARPFVVEAADRNVTALGTVFEVRLDPGRMEVTLVEGKVRVNPRTASGITAASTILKPGEEFVVERGAAQRVERVDVGTKLRWREGFVEFADVPLGEAVAEINRYSERAVTISDRALAAERISGVFRTGDSDRFAAIVGELLPIEVQSHPDRIELLRPLHR